MVWLQCKKCLKMTVISGLYGIQFGGPFFEYEYEYEYDYEYDFKYDYEYEYEYDFYKKPPFTRCERGLLQTNKQTRNNQYLEINRSRCQRSSFGM